MGLGDIITRFFAREVKSVTGLELPNVDLNPQPKPPKKKKEKPVKRTLALVILALAATLAVAQTATTTTTGFVAQSGPVAFHYDKTWSAATFVAERYPIWTGKASSFWLNGVELIAPTPNLNIYYGGGEYHPPLTNLTKYLNMPTGKFTVFANGAVGVGTIASGPNQISWLAGGGGAYQVSPSVAWQPYLVGCGRFGSKPYCGMSTTISYAFGNKK